MKDKVWISGGLLACFCTNPDYGFLDVVDGVVRLNKPKVFNTARRLLHAGVNIIRILRHAPWANPVRFDYDCDGFWQTMREYVQILHQPYQETNPGPGAEVWFEPFDGCGIVGVPNQTILDKQWIYSDHDRAESVLLQSFQWLADLPYVRIGCGNELNQGATVDLHDKCLFPTFHDYNIVPFSFGPTHVDGLLEQVKVKAEKFWEDRDKRIIRQLHSIRSSADLDWYAANWMNHPIRTSLSGNGCRPRPSPQEFSSVFEHIFDNSRQIEFSSGPDGKTKMCFERMAGENAEVAFAAASETYKNKFGVYPENYGKYPNDYIEPPPPEPPEPPTPPTPPTPPMPPVKSCSYFWDHHNYWAWLRCVLFGKH
jgi:hypothetical protein